MELLGGQAIIEGVMFRKGNNISIAVRKPNNEIVVKKDKLNLLSTKFNRIYFLRGIISLFEMIYVGTKALNYSANQATGDEEEDFSMFHFIIVFAISLVIALLLFKLLPLFLAQVITANLTNSNITFSLIDGMIKILLFMLYIYIVSFMPDIRRIFSYHGAEHKVALCHENKKKLTVKNAKTYSTIHPRCGTSFIMLVLIISIIVYTFIPMNFSFLQKYLYRIILLPVMAGISYEFLRFGAKLKNNWLLKPLIYPGLLLQKITTSEPTDDQLEVALAALEPLV